MKIINTNQSIKVPDEIDVSVKSRVVTVKGPRGTLTKSFKHLALDISMPTKKTVRVEKWFGKRKELAAVRTVCSHITNLFTGVTKVRTMLFVDYVRQLGMYVRLLFKKIVLKNEKFTLPKKCFVKSIIFSNFFTNTLISRNFCQYSEKREFISVFLHCL